MITASTAFFIYLADKVVETGLCTRFLKNNYLKYVNENKCSHGQSRERNQANYTEKLKIKWYFVRLIGQGGMGQKKCHFRGTTDLFGILVMTSVILSAVQEKKLLAVCVEQATDVRFWNF